MPPKKATSSETSDGKFIWEGANETKLLMIMLGRHIGTSEFEEVAKAFPGATPGAIRNRCGVLRAKQRNLYSSLGWELPSGSATPAKKGKGNGTPAKRAADEEGGGEVETPTKKSRKKKAVMSEKKDSGAEDEGMSDGVKDEDAEEV